MRRWFVRDPHKDFRIICYGMDLEHEAIISLKEVPIQWIPKFELFTNDLPNFPLVYVHSFIHGKRVFGFPMAVNFANTTNGKCIPKIHFLSNVDLNSDKAAKKIVESELSERFGIANSVTLPDVVGACNGDAAYGDFFKAIWEQVIKPDHGGSIPFGRYYEEFYSILRFSAAWNTAGRSGRQMELRIVYWFLREYGDKVNITIGDYSFYQFFLLPTFDEVRSDSMSEFPRLEKLFKLIDRIWNLEFTNTHQLQGQEIRSMETSWPNQRDGFVEYLNKKYSVRQSVTLLSSEDAYDLGVLADMFDRFPPRAAGFIWCVMNIRELDYRSWSRDFLDEFYLLVLSTPTVAIYPKVVSCFLQQGFANEHAIPMDDWILSFVKHALGLDGRTEAPDLAKTWQNILTHVLFFETFSNRAKLERLIWLISQSKKVNMDPVMDMLWCIRFGRTNEDGKKTNFLRQQNPITCYQCELRPVCNGYVAIQDSRVWITEGKISQTTKADAERNNCNFICGTASSVPKKIEVLSRSMRTQRWEFVDEFSGLRMRPEYTTRLMHVQILSDLMADLDRNRFVPIGRD